MHIDHSSCQGAVWLDRLTGRVPVADSNPHTPRLKIIARSQEDTPPIDVAEAPNDNSSSPAPAEEISNPMPSTKGGPAPMDTTPATSASPAASRMSRTKPNMPEEFLASPVLNGLSSKLSSKRKAETPMGCHLTQMTRLRDGLIADDSQLDLPYNRKKATLILSDGSRHTGYSFGAERSMSGEVVFNTAMVGYPESLTDPSYRGQILTLTFPLIGNYGVPSDAKDDLGLPAFFESEKVHISALLVSDYSPDSCHWNQVKSLGEWLKENGVPGLTGMDTRALTKRIREHGAMLGKIVFEDDDEKLVPQIDPNSDNLVAQVSTKVPKLYTSSVVRRLSATGKPIRILAIDCGMKANIIRYFLSKGVELLVVPWDHDFLSENFDGLFISNGPGDPTQCGVLIKRLSVALAREGADFKPVFGICLGNQLIALAAGCKTYKMKYGNRGANQPCIDTRTGRCYITAQNHGFAVDVSTIPEGYQQLFVNANDGSNEGLIHSTKNIFSVQFHPEACAGPTDTDFLFEMFMTRVQGAYNPVTTSYIAPMIGRMHKILLLGSGGLSIGQAGEFDYSGSQAIKALKEMQCHIVLVNPNIATVQTSAGMADRVYFQPVVAETVAQIIAKERPDGILLQFGGQTALNCGVELYRSGVLEKYNVKVLGTPVDAIVATEDRKIFAEKLREIHEKIAEGLTAETPEDVVACARKLGYPVILRAAFALGGLGSGFASNDEECLALATQALSGSPQVRVG